MVLQGLRDRIRYPAKGVVIDGDPGLVRGVRETFSEIPIQLCIKHLHSYHVYHLKYLFQGPKEGIELLLDIIYKMLYAKNSKHLKYLFEEYSLMCGFLIQKCSKLSY